MKKYFIIALAALGFAACAEKMNDGPSPEHTGELEQSYIAINLRSSELDTRADQAPNLGDGDLSDGIADEHIIKTVHFFFFRQGAPFAVNAFPGTAPGGTRNWQQATSVTFNDDLDNDNISKESNVVLVLDNYKGQYPDQVVAVINWNPAEKFYTLDELQETLSDLQVNGNGFVMSNSVYRSGEGKVINATAIPKTYPTAADAKADGHPVDIYVERIAAKVTVNTPTENTTNWNSSLGFDTGKSSQLITLDEKKVYVKILNWSLYNARTKSNLIKSINPDWTDDALGLNWNDSPRFRSYWAAADTYAGTADDYINKNVFNWTDGTDLRGALYCGENTAPSAEDRTKLILKGKLVDAEGKALELVKWNGQEMVTVESLKKAVAAQLQYLVYSYTYTSKDDKATYTYSPITYEDIECISGADEGAPGNVKKYQVFFQLKTESQNKNWAIKSGDSWEYKDETQINEYLSLNIPPATVYANGQTYYYIDIKHLGVDKSKPARYGIVRNHIYDIEIQSIKGYGTPVFIPGGNIVVPETPTEEEGVYVAAKINVLSWRVVKQGVNIEVK